MRCTSSPRRNGDGSHVFSATLEEQNAAVARYLSRICAQKARGGVAK